VAASADEGLPAPAGGAAEMETVAAALGIDAATLALLGEQLGDVPA
jgi:hypothetical protein